MPTNEHFRPELDTSGRHAQPPRRKGAAGTLLVLLGAGTLAGGIGLAILPLVSWKAQRLMENLSALGIESGALAIGGLGLVALGLLRRAVDAQRNDGASEDTLLLEQVAADLVQLRGSLETLEERALQQTAVLETLRAEVASLQQSSPQPQSSDALFQLASSLDKLGVRIDQRLKLHHSTLHDSLEELSATVDHSRRSLEERMASVAAATNAANLTQPAACCDELPADETLQFTTPQDSEPLAAPVHGTAPSAATQTPTRSLGLLDSFDDLGVAAPLPAIQREHGVDFDTLDQSSVELARELDRAARPASGSWDEQFMVDASAPSAMTSDETQNKLAQLQSLLGDERLRNALERMRRQG